MLVFTRKEGEEFILRDPLGIKTVITIIEIGSNRVRVGVQAPLSITVHRKEIQDKIDSQEAP